VVSERTNALGPKLRRYYVRFLLIPGLEVVPKSASELSRARLFVLSLKKCRSVVGSVKPSPKHEFKASNRYRNLVR
jgi:hypothetical protein